MADSEFGAGNCQVSVRGCSDDAHVKGLTFHIVRVRQGNRGVKGSVAFWIDDVPCSLQRILIKIHDGDCNIKTAQSVGQVVANRASPDDFCGEHDGVYRTSDQTDNSVLREEFRLIVSSV